jgi:hypothetical protein
LFWLLPAEMDALVTRLKINGLCKSAHYKELYIPESEINGELSNIEASSTFKKTKISTFYFRPTKIQDS